MFLLSITNLKELQYDDVLVLLYCSVAYLTVGVEIAIAETLSLFLKNTIKVVETQISLSPGFFFLVDKMK